MKIFELLAVMPDEQIAALAIVPAVFIGMRLLYGAWPWESRKTWYRTKPFVPVRQPPAKINSDAKEYRAKINATRRRSIQTTITLTAN